MGETVAALFVPAARHVDVGIPRTILFIAIADFEIIVSLPLDESTSNYRKKTRFTTTKVGSSTAAEYNM